MNIAARTARAIRTLSCFVEYHGSAYDVQGFWEALEAKLPEKTKVFGRLTSYNSAEDTADYEFVVWFAERTRIVFADKAFGLPLDHNMGVDIIDMPPKGHRADFFCAKYVQRICTASRIAKGTATFGDLHDFYGMCHGDAGCVVAADGGESRVETICGSDMAFLSAEQLEAIRELRAAEVELRRVHVVQALQRGRQGFDSPLVWSPKSSDTDVVTGSTSSREGLGYSVSETEMSRADTPLDESAVVVDFDLIGGSMFDDVHPVAESETEGMGTFNFDDYLDGDLFSSN